MDIKNTDLYALLGLKKENNPTQDQIKKAFRKASIKWHPDRWADASKEEQEEAQDKFQAINYANQILSDEKKKRIYDTTGNAEQADKGQEGFDPFSMFTGGAGGFSFNFGGDDFDIGEMFGFGSRRAGQAQARVVPGQDLQVRIKIKDISELFVPKEHVIRYKRNKRCPVCHGGSALKSHTCDRCHGSGVETVVDQSVPGRIVQSRRVCSKCGGTGKIYDQKCVNKDCKNGFVEETLEKTIVFPPGVQDTQVIVYESEGSESKSPQGPNGRLLVIAQYDFDQNKYRVDGINVTEKVEIPYEDCIIGTKFPFTHPDGKEMNITISPLTPPGKRLKLGGRGLTLRDQWGRSQTGDYIIEICYKLPDKLSEDETLALKDIQELHKKS